MMSADDKNGYVPLAVGATVAVLSGLGWLVYRRNRTMPNVHLPPKHSPFSQDARRAGPSDHQLQPPDDKKATLRRPISQNVSEVPSEVDVVVIGSGASGMTAAAVLAKSGLSVVLFEQHTKLGGCCHTFKENGFEFDTGLHYVGGTPGKSQHFQILEQLSEGQFIWDPLDECFDEVILGDGSGPFERFRIEKGFEQWRSTLKGYFPEESHAIDAFHKILRNAKAAEMGFGLLKFAPLWVANLVFCLPLKCVRQFYYYFHQTGMSAVEGLTKNKRLQLCFLYSYGDFGTPPSKAPLFMSAALNEHFISNGGFYPRHGASMIPYHLGKCIARHGGSYFTKAAVEQIIISNTSTGLKATGVKVRTTNNQSVTVNSKVVISSAGLATTFQRLVPAQITTTHLKKTAWLLKSCQPSVSYLTVFVGLNGSQADLQIPSRNFWMFSDDSIDKSFIKFVDEEDASDALEKFGIPLAFVGFPSTKDAGHAADKSTCVVIAPCPYRWFGDWDERPVKKRGDQYESLKEAFQTAMWGRVLQLFPQLEGKVAMMFSSTPVTSNYYLHTSEGELYGLDHNMARFSAAATKALRPETEVQGLYLTGQDLVACGVSTALSAGLMTAATVLDKPVHEHLEALYKPKSK